MRNVLTAEVEGQASDGGETRLRLLDGPALIVPFHDHPPGTRLTVEVRAEDILLARGPILGLSARNVIAGTVERVIAHGPEAEVLVRTGAVTWIASVVAPAVTALDLTAGTKVHLIIKARSCHILKRDPDGA